TRERAPEILALEQLHGQVDHARAARSKVEDLDDVGVVKTGVEPSLPQETRENVRVPAVVLGQDLERDGARERGVVGGVDRSHAAATQEPFDAIATIDQRRDQFTLAEALEVAG